MLLLGASGVGKTLAGNLLGDNPSVVSWNGVAAQQPLPSGIDEVYYIVLEDNGALAYTEVPDEWVGIFKRTGLVHRSWIRGAK